MTPHIEASRNSIAPLVIITGDPLRAKKMSNTLLTQPKLVNQIRNQLIYTGKYKDLMVSIVGCGIGHSSIALYVEELFAFYNVKVIIRVGSCGAFKERFRLLDVVNVCKSYADYLYYQKFYSQHWAYPCPQLQATITTTKNQLGYQSVAEINALTDAAFYMLVGKDNQMKQQIYQQDVVEMEAYGLFVLAKKFNRHAACILTVSDLLIFRPEQNRYEAIKKLTVSERINKFKKAFILALETLVN